MSRCFACDAYYDYLSEDKATGREYCSTCFQPTVEEMLRLEGKERYMEEEPQVVSLDELQENEEDQEIQALEEDGVFLPWHEDSA